MLRVRPVVPLRLLAVMLLAPFFFALLAAGLAAPASAHATLVSADPADGSVLEKAPATATLKFSEPVTLPRDAVEVFDAHGTRLEASASGSGERVRIDLPDQLTDGSHVITWRLVSADGHPITGSLTFAIGAPSASVVVPGGQPTTDATVSVALKVVQGMGYAALFLAVGLLMFITIVLPDTGRVTTTRRSLVRVLRGASAAAIALFAVLPPLHGVALQGLDLSDLVTASAWDVALVGPDLASLLLVAIGLGVGSLVVARPGRWRSLTLLAAVVASAGPALAGHTRGADPVPLLIVTDVVHVAAGAFWVGGVVGLVVALRPAASGEDGQDPGHDAQGAATVVVRRFSAAAAAVLVALALSGTLLAWRISGSLPELVGSTYGQVLGAKVAVVAVAVAIAAVNRWVLLPRLDAGRPGGDPGGWHRSLRRTLAAEAALLAGVLALATVLTNQTPNPQPASADPQQSSFVTGELDDDHQVLVLMDPQQVGPTQLHIHLVTTEGQPVDPYAPPAVSLRSETDELGRVDLVARGEGIYTADIVIPSAGEWQVSTSVRMDEFTNPVATVTLTVE